MYSQYGFERYKEYLWKCWNSLWYLSQRDYLSELVTIKPFFTSSEEHQDPFRPILEIVESAIRARNLIDDPSLSLLKNSLYQKSFYASLDGRTMRGERSLHTIGQCELLFNPMQHALVGILLTEYMRKAWMLLQPIYNSEPWVLMTKRFYAAYPDAESYARQLRWEWP